MNEEQLLREADRPGAQGRLLLGGNPSVLERGGRVLLDRSIEPTITQPTPEPPDTGYLSRAGTGAVAGFFAPEALAATGRVMSRVPYAPVRAAGLALQAGAPLMRPATRVTGAAVGAGAGAAGEAVERGATEQNFSPEASKALGMTTETLLGALPYGYFARAMRPPAPTPATPEQLRNMLRETLEPATGTTNAELTRLRQEQLRREIATRKLSETPERQPQTQEQIEQAARTDARLAPVDTPTDFAANRNLDADIRRASEVAAQRAQATQREVGGKAFDDYRRAADELQMEMPFGASPEGVNLRRWLNVQIRGGSGELRSVSNQERAGFVKIRNELFGRPRSDAPTEVIPGQTSAAEQAETAEAGRKRMVDWRLIEREIRRLRDVGQRGEALGFNRLQQDEAKSAADTLENALNGWLARGGEGARPRVEYARASEAYNRFLTDFGQALTQRQEVPFGRADLPLGVFSTGENRLASIIFRDRDTVRFASELMGAENVRKFAERYASNQLRGMDAAGVSRWLENPANTFVYSDPALTEKIARYGMTLAQREGNAATMRRLQDQLRRGLEASRGTTTQRVQELEKLQSTLNDAAARFDRAEVGQMGNVWRNTVRPRLEQSGLFDRYELDSLERQINTAVRSSNRNEAKTTLQAAIGDLVKTKARQYALRYGLPLAAGGALGAGYVGYELAIEPLLDRLNNPLGGR